jgi:hypothetical protein
MYSLLAECPHCCCCQEEESAFYLYLLPGQLVVSSTPQQQQQQQQPQQQQPAGLQLSALHPIAAMGGLDAFRAQLAAHLATYAASGGAEPGRVLAARSSAFAGGQYATAGMEGGILWYPVRHMGFLRDRKLSFAACVVQGQEQLAGRSEALLHVFVPAVQPADSGAVGAAGSAQVGTAMPGRLQLPGLWQEVACLEVTVGTNHTGAYFYHPGGWQELQHLEDHFMLALSAVSGSLPALYLDWGPCTGSRLHC